MAQDPQRRTFARYWLPVLLYVALIFTLSSIPRLRPLLHFPNSDKVMHMTEYFLLGLLLVRALRTLPRLGGVLVAGLLAVSIGAAVGGADELYQHGVPGRETSVFDWVADSLGLSLAQIGYAWLKRPKPAA